MILDYLDGSTTITSLYKKEVGGPKSENEMWPQKQKSEWRVAGSEDGRTPESGAKEYRQPLEAGKGKKTDAPWSLQKKRSLDTTFILAQWNPFWTSDLQNCENKCVFCFKPRSPWSFVTAAVGANTRLLLRPEASTTQLPPQPMTGAPAPVLLKHAQLC